MRLTNHLPKAVGSNLANDQQLRDFAANLAWPSTGWLANLVVDESGAFWGRNGSSRDVSNHTDLQVLIGLRQGADGLLVSAKTAKAEQYSASKHAPIAILGRKGDFAHIPAAQEPNTKLPVILLTPIRRWLKARIRFQKPNVRVVPLLSLSAQFLATTISALGWSKVLVEAGPQLTGHLVRVGLVKQIQIAVTGGPKLTSAAAQDIAKQALTALSASDASVLQVFSVDGTFFTRWAVGN